MALSPKAQQLRKQMVHPLFYRFWLFVKLPAAAFAGVLLRELEEGRCVVTIPYGWRSQNPFQSIYFAVQAMAAELSTGALVVMHTADQPFSTLILDIQGSFGKKANGRVWFTCEQGDKVTEAVAEAVATGEPRTVALETVGRMADGTEVSRFVFTWSIKARKPR